MKFEVITKGSVQYYGALPTLVGEYRFEFVKDGKVGLTDVRFSYGDADACAAESRIDDGFQWDIPVGAVLTGRVEFLGYNTERYDSDEREEYFLDATAEEIRYALEYRDAHYVPSEDEISDEYEEYYEQWA